MQGREESASSNLNPILKSTAKIPGKNSKRKSLLALLKYLTKFDKKFQSRPVEKLLQEKIMITKNFDPETRSRMIEEKIVFRDIFVDAEPEKESEKKLIIDQPDEITKLSTIVEIIRRKNGRKSMEENRGQDMFPIFKGKVVQPRKKLTADQPLNKYTQVIIKKKQKQEIPSTQPIAKARLISLLEKLYNKSFPGNVVAKIIERFSVEDKNVEKPTGNNKVFPSKLLNSSRNNKSIIFPKKVTQKSETKIPKLKTNDKMIGNTEKLRNGKYDVILEDFINANRVERSVNGRFSGISKTRGKRSVENSSTDVPTEGKVVSQSLYRHPKLSFEDQREALSALINPKFLTPPKIHLKITTAKPDFLYKRIWDIINDTRAGWGGKESSDLSNRTGNLKKSESRRLEKPYVPVLADCKDEKKESALEVADLNVPPTGSNFRKLKKVNSARIDGSESNLPASRAYTFESLTDPAEDFKRITPFTPNPSKDTEEALSRRPINVLEESKSNSSLEGQEDRSVALNSGPEVATYPPDIPPYNPDKIPYVEVPDYSDQREESLDKEEQRRKGKHYSDEEVVDPVSDKTEEKEEGKSPSVNPRADEEESETGTGSSLPTNQETNVHDENEEQESPNEEKGGQLRRIDEEPLEEREESEKTQNEEQVEDFEVHFDINEYKKPFNLDEFIKNDPIFKKLREYEAADGENGGKDEEVKESKREEDKKEEKQQVKKEIPVYEENQDKEEDYSNIKPYKKYSRDEYGYRKPLYRGYDGQSERSNFSQSPQENSDEDKKPELESSEKYDYHKPLTEYNYKESEVSKSSENPEENSEEDKKTESETNEKYDYRKPLTKESYEQYEAGNSSENPPENSEEDRKSSESGSRENYYKPTTKENYEQKENNSSSENSEENPDGSDKYSSQSSDNYNYKPSEDNEDRSKDSREDPEKYVSEDEFKYGDKNFFAPFFGRKKKNAEEENDEGEKDFVSRYFSEDVKRQLKENSAEESRQREKEKRDDEEKQENVYKTLSEILDKKDVVSRLDDNVNKRMADNGQSSPKYTNFWLLEYGSPRKEKTNSNSET